MLYSADSLRTVELISDRIRHVLKQRAIHAAITDGRALVTSKDVWAAFDKLVLSDLDFDPDRTDDD